MGALLQAKADEEAATQSGDKAKLAEILLNLANLHVIAGQMEDYQRQQMYMPIGTRHAGAAGRAAEQAKVLCMATGNDAGTKKADIILNMERVEACKATRSTPFYYDYKTYK